MKKSYSYETTRFSEVLNRHHIRQVDVQKALGYTNSIMVKSWRDGKDMYAGKMCQICNIFGIDIHEFFVPQEEAAEEPKYETDFEARIAEQRKKKEEENCEAMQKTNIGKAECDIDFWLRKIDAARENERNRQEEIRTKEMLRYESIIEKNRKDFDQEIMEKNKEILDGQRKYSELSLRNKELERKVEQLQKECGELELSRFKGASQTGVAEPSFAR